MRSPRAALLVLLAAAIGVAACGERSALGPEAPSDGLVDIQATAILLPTIERATALPTDVSASATIGAAGGTLRLDAIGVTVTLPKGALETPTTITVTAPAGASVTYLFQPHGLVFAQPVRIEQDLRFLLPEAFPKGTSAVAGYFADDMAARNALAGGTIEVEELLPATVDTRGNRIVFTVRHFSGYMVSSGSSEVADTLQTTAGKHR